MRNWENEQNKKWDTEKMRKRAKVKWNDEKIGKCENEEMRKWEK